MPVWLKLILIAVGVIAGLIALDRLLLWMESRGWIYWRKTKRKGSMMAGLRSFQELVEPQIQRIEEDCQGRLAADKDEQGAPPSKQVEPSGRAP